VHRASPAPEPVLSCRVTRTVDIPQLLPTPHPSPGKSRGGLCHATKPTPSLAAAVMMLSLLLRLLRVCTDVTMPLPGMQNHRMVGVGRDLCGSSSPTLLPKQGYPEQAVEDLVQAGPEYLQRRRLHNPPGQPGPGLRHPQREEVLPHVQLELPLLQFVLIAPCPVTGHHWKESGPILLTPTLEIFVSIY